MYFFRMYSQVLLFRIDINDIIKVKFLKIEGDFKQ